MSKTRFTYQLQISLEVAKRVENHVTEAGEINRTPIGVLHPRKLNCVEYKTGRSVAVFDKEELIQSRERLNA